MKSTVRFCQLLCPVLVLLQSLSLAQEVNSITMGNVAELIGETVPAVPPGYNSLLELTGAWKSGREKIIRADKPVPGIRISRDVVYGTYGDKSVKLDLYEPSRHVKPKGGLVFIHGGGWKHGSKHDYIYYGKTFAAKGYVVASIDYRLSGEAPFPAAVHDCKCAVRWMRSEAKKLKIDPARIAVAGGSAGGHLSLMVGYSSDGKSLEGEGGHNDFSSAVAGVVNLYGPADMVVNFVQDGVAFPLVQDFVGQSFKAAPELYKQASPLTYLDERDPPTLILHGTIDDLVPISQSDELAKQLKALNIPYVYDRIPGWPHAMDLTQSVNDRCVWLMERFFEKVFESEAL